MEYTFLWLLLWMLMEAQFTDMQGQDSYVTRSDKKGLITRSNRCLINNLYFHFSVSNNNSVNISKIPMNFHISDANV